MEDQKNLIEDFIRSVQTLHCDIDGNHKYMLSHRSHHIISRMKAYLGETQNAATGSGQCSHTDCPDYEPCPQTDFHRCFDPTNPGNK